MYVQDYGLKAICANNTYSIDVVSLEMQIPH